MPDCYSSYSNSLKRNNRTLSMEDTDKKVDEPSESNKKDEIIEMKEIRNSVDEIDIKADESHTPLEDKEKGKPAEPQKAKIERKKKISGLKQSSKINSDIVPSNESKEDDGECLIFHSKLMLNFVF